MKTSVWTAPILALALMTAVAGCTTSSRTSESTGEYVDDAAITAKVKTAMLTEPGLDGLQISVETYKNAVQLSGFVDNAAAKDRAGGVARGISGVRSVQNNLIVK